MQSCPKNVLTGPLTGDSKRSNISSIAKESVPLPPVALALPLEPASATGPPSPARGSAGMPPPPSPAGATYQQPPTPKQEAPELLDLKPAEKKRKARVGKAMVRNTIAAQNTMLLMCQPTNQNIYLDNLDTVKREVVSPKENDPKKDSSEQIELNSKTDPVITQMTQATFENLENNNDIIIDKTIDTIQNVQCLKTEDKKEIIPLIPEAITKVEEEVALQPCVKTVAENVKVKNMKRKHSFTSETRTETEVACPAKKLLLQKPPPPCANGSYKDLIKKSTTSIKINNGRKKLVEARGPRRAKLTRLKRAAAKRKLSLIKEDACNNNNKRLKPSKPLTASNLHNSKQNAKENKENAETIEINKEPIKKNLKKPSVNCKKTAKKTAPIVLDNLIAKNNIDRTIDCVVGESITRTLKNIDPSALKTQEKCKVKQDVKKESVTCKKSTNSKTIVVKSSKVECRKTGASKRKTKNSIEVIPQVISRNPRRSLQLPKWSNGWTWEGEPYEAKVFLNVSSFINHKLNRYIN